MAGRYVTLVAGADHLEGEGVTGFVTARAIACEKVADARIESAFAAWDRSAWFEGTIPPDVRTIALKLGSGEYLRRSFNKASPDAGVPAYAQTLIDEAEALISEIKAAGVIYDVDGVALEPVTAGAGGMFPPVSG